MSKKIIQKLLNRIARLERAIEKAGLHQCKICKEYSDYTKIYYTEKLLSISVCVDCEHKLVMKGR